MTEDRRLQAWVSGRVQGVAFRWHAVREAQRLQLSGRVRNLVDGRVEIIAEGPRQRLEQMLIWARVGSPGSHVDDIEFQFEAASGEFEDFTQLR